MTENPSFPEIHPDLLRHAAQNRLGVWASLGAAILSVAILGVSVSMAWVVLPAPSEKLPYGAWRLALILGPSFLALIVFEALERQRIVLHRAILLFWVITAAFYVAVVNPLLHQVFQLDQWASMIWWAAIIADFLITAPLEVLLIYLALRYGVFSTSLFQRQVDGVLFGTIAGMSVAVMGGVIHWGDASYNAVWLCIRILGYLTLGGWMGYFLGVARFRRTQLFYLAGGFFLTVMLHTIYTAFMTSVHTLTPWAPPYASILVAMTFSIVNFGILAWLIQRRNHELLQAASWLEKRLGDSDVDQPQALLADLVPMAQALKSQSPPVHPLHVENTEDIDELTHLKQSWDALIAEQEGTSPEEDLT